MKLGLALAGGGVKGAAHIGVLKALEENNIKISAISGASIGSIVATLYAMGYKPEIILQIFKYFAKEIMKTDTKYVVSNLKKNKSIFGYGILSGEKTQIAMKECAKEKNIEYIKDIKMPLAITTVDIVKSKKYVFTNNNNPNSTKKNNSTENQNEDYYITEALIDKAVQASCSYPLVFAPCEYLNHKFVDGGILDNVPACEVRKLGVDKVMTVKFSAGLDYEPKSMLEVAFKSIDILFEGRAQEAIKASDFVMDLDLAQASVFNIKKIDYCYNIGYNSTIAKINEIKKMLN